MPRGPLPKAVWHSGGPLATKWPHTAVLHGSPGLLPSVAPASWGLCAATASQSECVFSSSVRGTLRRPGSASKPCGMCRPHGQQPVGSPGLVCNWAIQASVWGLGGVEEWLNWCLEGVEHLLGGWGLSSQAQGSRQRIQRSSVDLKGHEKASPGWTRWGQTDHHSCCLCCGCPSRS